MGVLSTQALQGIASYKYKPGTYTVIDNLMTPFWNWAVTLLPMWIAPNLVTLIGSMMVVVSTMIQCYYSPNFVEEAPQWVYFNCGISLFLYQTLDAIDGKQARRTGSSSPLGQLFDHGCDALCVVFNMIGCACTMGFGPSWKSLVLLYAIAWPFFLAQWDEYHTGTMSSGNGYFGVTEGQLTLVFVHIVTGFAGQSIWKTQLHPMLPYSIDDILFVALCVSNFILSISSIKNVFTCDGKNMDKEEIGSKHIGKDNAILQIFPMFLLFVLGFFWISGPGAAMFAQYPFIYMMALGIGFVFITTRMIICHMSKVAYPLQFRLVIPLILVLLNLYAPYFGWVSHPILSPSIVTLCFVMYITLVYLHFVVNAVSEICNHLDIECFKIRSKSD